MAKDAGGPRSCPEGQHWVNAHPRKAYTKADGTLVRASFVSAHCRENSKGYSFWKPRLLFAPLQNWPKKVEVAKPWAVEEEERVLEVLGELPDGLWTASIMGLYRVSKSEDPANEASTRPSTGEIVLYDDAFRTGRNLARILAHELAHIRYKELLETQRNDYWAATSWFDVAEAGGASKLVRRKSGFIQEDGKTSPEEDFANNIEAFLFEPERLAEVTPAAHAWIKKQFGDNFTIRRRARESKK